jgi:large subunit ribosomal protein L21
MVNKRSEEKLQNTVPTFEKYAIFQTGGKQYQAIEGKTIAIEKVEGNPGDTLEFTEVLFRKKGAGKFEVGTPILKGAIKASIVKHSQGPKVIAFRFKRRKKVRVKRGHRQPFTVIRIEAA